MMGEFQTGPLALSSRLIRLFLFSLVGLSILSCERNVSQDLPLEIVGYDTTVFKGGNFRFIGTKYGMSDQSNFVMIHQGREIYWFDVAKDSMVKSINLDTMDLVLPEGNLLQALYQERDSSLILFFPQRNKVFHLDAELKVEREVGLSGIQEFEHMFMPYGNVFFYDTLAQQYLVGMISNKLGDFSSFLHETRFVGGFDARSGKLKFAFGEFGEERKKIKSDVNSEGSINFGYYNNKFYIQEKVGSSVINKYDAAGNLENSYEIGSYFLSYKLDPNQGGFDEDHVFNDHNYGMVVANPNRVVSVGVKFKDESRNVMKHYGILLVEELEKGLSYSAPINPFQFIIWANDSEIYLVTFQRNSEDMILVKAKYKLGESTQD